MGKKNRGGGKSFSPFGKKQNDAANAVEKEPEQEVQPTRKGRVEEPLLHETVWETTVDCCRTNPLFTVKRDEEEFFVGLYMPFTAIGGLSKKESRHNESKGSIVGQINHGKIAVMNTSSLIAKEAVVFIPTESSLSNMAEYSLLADTAKYEFCFINAETGELELTGIKTGLVEMQALHLENRSVATIPSIRKLVDAQDDTGKGAKKSNGPIAATTAAPVGAKPAAPVAAPVADYVEPSIEDEDFEEEEGFDEPADYENYGGEMESLDDDPDYHGDDYYQEPPLEDELEAGDYAPPQQQMYSEQEEELDVGPAYAPDIAFTPEDTQRAIRRRFFNDDIQTELTTAPLDQALADVIPFHAIPYRPGGWLEDQINARIGTMNQEMQRLHQENLAAVRQRYLDGTVAMYMDAMKVVDAFEDTEEYQKAKAALDELLENSTAEIAERRKQLSEEFERNVKLAGETARAEAEDRYRVRYQPQLEQRADAIAGEVTSGMKATFESFVSRRKAELKHDSMLQLDSKNQELITACCEQYAELAEKEASMRKMHEDSLRQFLEDNRKDEVTRISTLAEEQAREDRVARLQSEYDGHVSQLKKQFDALGDAHEANIRSLKERHADEMTAQENVHRRDIAIYASDNQRQQSRIDQLTQSLVDLDAKKAQEYAAKIAELEAQRDAGEAKYQDLVSSQRKGNKLMVTIAAITAILCLAIGVLAGQFLFSYMDAERNLIDDLKTYVSQQGEMPSQNVDVEQDAQNGSGADIVIDTGANGGNNANTTTEPEAGGQSEPVQTDPTVVTE